MTTLSIRRALPGEVVDIAALWTRASEWLATTGTDQWQYPVRVHAIRGEVAAGEVWVVRADDGRLIATVTLEDSDQSGLWQAGDQPERALYVHRLVVARSDRPAELGSSVLDWAGRRASAMGRDRLRLDAWTTNPGLHKYYLDHGFQHVRTVDKPDVVSGVLFERAASVQLRRGPALAEEDIHRT